MTPTLRKLLQKVAAEYAHDRIASHPHGLDEGPAAGSTEERIQRTLEQSQPRTQPRPLDDRPNLSDG